MKLDYSISDVSPYINWVYFFHAWGSGRMPRAEQAQLRNEAEQRLRQCEGHYAAHAVFGLFSAHSQGDDLLLDGVRLPLLRQQAAGSQFLSLADFVSPQADQVGVFAATVDRAMVDDSSHDPYEQMMMQLLADRLAEATAERLHEEVRKHYWGYAPHEHLSIEEMLLEHFQGIRPAVGYPSMPDTSINFIIHELIDLRQIGVSLTESGAMRPHASVSGLMIAHPEAHYFSIGTIGHDQLADYARRRGVPIELMRKFLGGNLQ